MSGNIHNKYNVIYGATSDKFAHAYSRRSPDSEMLKRVQHLLQKMQLSSPFVVAETVVDRRHLCGSGYTPVGVYSMLYINIFRTNITIQNTLQYCLII